MTNLVRDLMHSGVITCQSDATLGQVAVLLTQHRVHALVVNDPDDRPLGIITDFDLLAGEWLSTNSEDLDTMLTMTAYELLSAPIDTVEADVPVGEAAHRILQEGIHRLLVTERQKPIGVISILDFVAGLVRRASVRREKVADVMTSAVLICRDKTPITAAAKAMINTGLRSILVVNRIGHQLGAVSGIDFLNSFREKDVSDKTVSDLMVPTLTIQESASLREAADQMIEHHYHRLVVVDSDRPEAMPLGIISSYDIVAEMAKPGSVWQQ